MSSSDLDTFAEIEAKKAEEYDGFSSLKLSHLKSQVEELLNVIGNEGIFDTYTKHDISHINAMLENLEWIIPEDTKEVMTPADWLMTVIAVYFHDLGLLVTSNEFEDRHETEFQAFVEEDLYADDAGEDYKSRIEKIPEEDRERFRYQEFVRHNHAERVKNWILGEHNEELGGAEDVIQTIDELLSDLGKPFRRDLAHVCESHHRQDLDDLDKYNPSSPYGNSPQETANLQYCAILLRTADLLHITSDRAPSIMFRAINPSDPVSQQEWAKQGAVRNIRPVPSLRDDNNADDEIIDTIEVHAHFDDADGFFALTEYLDYAEDQLQYCDEVIEATKDKTPEGYQFPWRHITDEHVEAEGFERNSFEFTLDQERILDLLTGHTLYNDTDVVIRELVQNSIDAIRLRRDQDIEANTPDYNGKVEISWDPNEEMLEIADNGTGMTQKIIEDHLLTVGASRYQAPQFQEDYPNFHAISEFGIGILSSFMVANHVEILTGHVDEDPPRQISFRSVHGRYLIQHLDQDHQQYDRINPHGTIVRLKLRPSADIGDIREICERWFVVPPCDIKLSIQGENTVEIGYESVEDALESFVSDNIDQLPKISSTDDVKIKTSEHNGVNVSYAVRHRDLYNDWHFLEGYYEKTRWDTSSPESADLPPLGISIEGIRITKNAPGFENKPVIAMANLTGQNRPRTNVARTGLKSGERYHDTVRSIYKSYFDHVEDEIEELHKNRSYSLSWAVRESQRICSSLDDGTPTETDIYNELGEKVTSTMMEINGKRRSISISEAESYGSIWTIDSSLLRRSDRLFRDLPQERSYKELIDSLELSDYDIPDDPILCNFDQRELPQALSNREPARVEMKPGSKRVDVKWEISTDDNQRWTMVEGHRSRRRRNKPIIFVQTESIPIEGGDDENVIRTAGTTLLLSSSPCGKYFAELLSNVERDGNGKHWAISFVLSQVLDIVEDQNNVVNDEQEFIENMRSDGPTIHMLEEHIDISRLYRSYSKTDWRVFSPSIWFDRFSSY